MISILIPTYNYNCFRLVESLHKQAEACAVPYEIIVIDDASTEKEPENQKINSLSHCQYAELKQNIGRSKIRNLLAKKAQYDCLLFMDCDLELISKKFISKYILSYTEKETIICGGLIYSETPPARKNLYLHWKYGHKREVKSIQERKRKPYQSFLSSNFLINKSVFLQICFNEEIIEYGHEDTLFGIELKKQKFTILHIDNPVIHSGLQSSDLFIEKEQKSIENLQLISRFEQIEVLSKDIRILKYGLILKKLHLINTFAFLHKVTKPLLEKQLKSSYPSLFILDIYKLTYWCTLQ